MHYNFIVDCSGSMATNVNERVVRFGKVITPSICRWEAMRHSVQTFLMQLQTDDTFSIIEFESTTSTLVSNMSRSDKGFDIVIRDLENGVIKPISSPYGRRDPIFTPRGLRKYGTNIVAALKATIRQSPHQTPTINLLFTDLLDQNDPEIFEALMQQATSFNPEPMLVDLMENGPLGVMLIVNSFNSILADEGSKALTRKVNKYFIERYSHKQLQKICKQFGLSAGGKKQDLIQRLMEHMQSWHIDDYGRPTGIRPTGFAPFFCDVITFEKEYDLYAMLNDGGVI